MMPTERVIGIDFGTSTSVIRVKRYHNGIPVETPNFAQAVTFNMGNTMVPTLIQRSGQETYYGFEAQIPHRNAKLFQNFKIELESEDPSIRQKARDLTAEFLKYLYQSYHSQQEHLGENDDIVRAIISYPVKWQGETKQFMIDAMKAAGFPKVEGMDEAAAAIHTITVQHANDLFRRGYFQKGTAIHILLVDMGAGTTDLVLCRYVPGGQKMDILCTWPTGGEILFGGREADLLLQEYVKSKLPAEEADAIMKRCGVEKVKAWKENIVSPALKKDETVHEFSELDMIADLLGIETEDYALNRMVFETIGNDYLLKLPELVNGCLTNAGVQGKDIDLVILTGGHSQWYFAQEMLAGRMKQFGDMGLSAIEADPARIITIPLPQETVALGLVFSPMEIWAADPLEHVDMSPATCTSAGNIEYWMRKSDGAIFLDSLGQRSISLNATRIPSLGHEYQLVNDGNEQIEKCVRCGAVGLRKPIIQQNPAAQPVSQPKDDEPASESEFVLGNIGNDYEILRYTGKRSRVIIPEKIRGREIVSIGPNAFSSTRKSFQTKSLTYVKIPNTVKTIKEYAFANCEALVRVDMHKDIQRIEAYAFLNCFNIQYLDFGVEKPLPKVVFFPKGLKLLGAYAFALVNMFGNMLFCLKSPCYLREATISKNTKVAKATLNCAVFYYEDTKKY